ncbi:hypothetical protein fugu_008350 [Takifugu bimaculatus]|uniref:PID domain-containing protein n=1 Tax=Takifugu bimaculatus TaxID=433685 RepID=A0A4Z2B2N8_9TELE|nr:hypothetical protein fugu_008350 [Takifugu bimaculatus]
MEGLYFEVKSRRGEKERISDNRHPNLTSCSAISRRSSSSLLYCKPSSMRRRMEAISQENEEENDVVEVRYKLTLIGSLSVHYLTTMAMLPWVVAEISKAQDSEKKPAERGPSPQIVFLCVSVSWVRCVSILGEELLWDPLTHRLLFECLPHQVTKLIHNSQEPSSFGCLVRDSANCACYVFRCQDSSKALPTVPAHHKATAGVWAKPGTFDRIFNACHALHTKGFRGRGDKAWWLWAHVTNRGLQPAFCDNLLQTCLV